MVYTIQQDTTILNFICEINKGISKQTAKNIIKYSIIIIDGKKIKAIPSLILNKGQRIEIKKQDETKNLYPTKDNPYVIKYEDKYLMVAIKPVGVLTSKQGNQDGVSFVGALSQYISQRDKRRTLFSVVHRLDREVEGLLIFAKSDEIREKLQENWQNVTKKYLCLTEDRPKDDHGYIESWLVETKNYAVIAYDKEVPNSKYAKTEYQYLRPSGKFHLLEVTLHTGRKNQIRAQLSSIGCPIVGDKKYGANDTYTRQVRLVSFFLQFTHPVTGQFLTFEYKPNPKFYKPSLNGDEHYKVAYKF